MPLLKQWKEGEASWGIWKVEESFLGLRSRLSASLPYDGELKALKADSRKLEYVAVRVLLCILCGEEKQILHYPSGKPYLADGSFRITISHTKGYVAVGIHPSHEVGIDIEYHSERVRKITSRFLRADEYAVSLESLLLHWSAKETMYKMMGQEEVDLLAHLRIFPFELQTEGKMDAQEYRTPMQACFRMRYLITADFVCTWCTATTDKCF